MTSLENDVNIPPKSNKQKNLEKIVFLLTSVLKVNDEKIAGSGSISQRPGSESVPKCHGSATLALALQNMKNVNEDTANLTT